MNRPVAGSGSRDLSPPRANGTPPDRRYTQYGKMKRSTEIQSDPGTKMAPPSPDVTLWGLTPVELHDQFWAARGVKVVRHGEGNAPIARSELYLLTGAEDLVIFKLRELLDFLRWVKPRVIFVRQHEPRRDRLGRALLTTDPQLAQRWREGEGGDRPARAIRRELDRSEYVTSTVAGRTYRANDDEERSRFVHALTDTWEQPDMIVRGLRRCGPHAWRHESAAISSAARIVGAVWIGIGRQVPADAPPLAGPAVLWDRDGDTPSDAHQASRADLASATASAEQTVSPQKATAKHAVGRPFPCLERKTICTIGSKIEATKKPAWLRHGVARPQRSRRLFSTLASIVRGESARWGAI